MTFNELSNGFSQQLQSYYDWLPKRKQVKIVRAFARTPTKCACIFNAQSKHILSLLSDKFLAAVYSHKFNLAPQNLYFFVK